MIVEMCCHYKTAGHPDFKPVCTEGHKASLKCHKMNPSCPDYHPSEISPYWKSKGKETNARTDKN